MSDADNSRFPANRRGRPSIYNFSELREVGDSITIKEKLREGARKAVASYKNFMIKKGIDKTWNYKTTTLASGDIVITRIEPENAPKLNKRQLSELEVFEQTCPYGIWYCENDVEILFNRERANLFLRDPKNDIDLAIKFDERKYPRLVEGLFYFPFMPLHEKRFLSIMSLCHWLSGRPVETVEKQRLVIHSAPVQVAPRLVEPMTTQDEQPLASGEPHAGVADDIGSAADADATNDADDGYVSSIPFGTRF